MPSGGHRFRVALHSGIWVRNDAISASLAIKMELIDRLVADGWPITATAFVHDAEIVTDRVQIASGPQQLVAKPAFRHADLHIFEFGIHYPNFDVVYLLPPNTPSVAVYHNITPPELVETGHQRLHCHASHRQLSNLFEMDRVVCDSEFNRDDLLRLGVDSDRLSVIHLPANVEPESPLGTPGGAQEVEVLYCGRFARAKGLDDLFAAMAILAERGQLDFTLTLAGDSRFSSTAYLRRLDAHRRDPRLRSHIRVVDGPSDGDLSALYRRSDIFVQPSHHEGYCVPVVEALLHGCLPVTSDAGNLPNIVGDCGMVFPAHDPRALASALGRAVEAVANAGPGTSAGFPTVRGRVSPEEWRRRVTTHLAGYSREEHDRAWTGLLARYAGSAGHPLPKVGRHGL